MGVRCDLWRVVATVVLGSTIAACASRTDPRLIWEGVGPPSALSASERAGLLAAGAPGVRSGPWGEARDATYQLLDVEAAELPHVHERHDLTVVVLRGSGLLTVEDRQYGVRAGDVMHIGRGKAHYFRPFGKVIGMAVFAPELREPDFRRLPE